MFVSSVFFVTVCLLVIASFGTVQPYEKKQYRQAAVLLFLIAFGLRMYLGW